MSTLKVVEIMPYMNERSTLGRVVINPPRSMPPLKEREMGEIKICCGRAFLSEDSYNKHQEERSDHLQHLWNDRLIPDDPSECSEATTIIFEESPQNLKPISNSQPTSKKGNSSNAKQKKCAKGQAKCHLCGIITSRSNFMRHIKTAHSPSNKHKCRWCSCVFPSKENALRHSSRVHPVEHKKYYWNAAAQNKQVISARAIYMKENNTGRKNASGVNSKPKVQERSLKETNRLFATKRKRDIKCIFCGKIMANKHSFQLHLLIHSGDRPYKCKLCGYAFRHPNNLGRHYKQKHSDECKFKCKHCPDRKYLTKEALMEHKKRQHKKEFLSPKTQAASTSKIALRLRSKTTAGNIGNKEKAMDSRVVMKMKPILVDGGYQCRICDKIIKNIETYRGHILIHANLFPHKCQQCSQNFRLKSTLDTHVKTNHVENGNFKCELCPCTFSLERALRRHAQCYHSGKRNERGGKAKISPQDAALRSLREISPDISTLGSRVATPLNHNLRSASTKKEHEKKDSSPTHRQKNTPGKRKLNFLSGESVRSRNVTRALTKQLEDVESESVKTKSGRISLKRNATVLQNSKTKTAQINSNVREKSVARESVETVTESIDACASETVKCDSPDENLSLFEVKKLKMARSRCKPL